MKKSLRHDFYFKKLLGSLFLDFIELFFPDMFLFLDPASVLSMDKEILGDLSSKQTNHADLVMKAKFKNQDSFFLIHIESQAQHQPDFPRRFHNYFTKLIEKYNLPVYPIVVFSFDTPLKPQPSSYHVRFADLEVLKFTYRSVQLNRLHWQDFIGILNPVSAALISKMRIAPSERPAVKLRCMSLLHKLNRDHDTNRLVSGFIDTYLRLNPLEMEEYKSLQNKLDPELKEAVMDFETSWKIEGREEGRQLGMAALLTQQLSRRFGSLSQESIDKIQQLSSGMLLKLNDATFDFKSSADLNTWLAKHNS